MHRAQGHIFRTDVEVHKSQFIVQEEESAANVFCNPDPGRPRHLFGRLPCFFERIVEGTFRFKCCYDAREFEVLIRPHRRIFSLKKLGKTCVGTENNLALMVGCCFAPGAQVKFQASI